MSVRQGGKRPSAAGAAGATGAATPAPAGGVAPLPEREVERPSALSRYLAGLAQYPPISREREHELALRWFNERDSEAGRELVLANLRLVVKIAMEYKRAWASALDLIQEGNLGLLEAVQRFDPHQGAKLSTYAGYWIRAYILKWLIDNIRLVKLSQTRAQRKLFFRLGREKRALEREGFRPEPKLIAARLDVDEADVVEMETRLGQGELSVNAPLGDGDDGAEYGDLIAAAGDSPEQVVQDEELRRLFNEKVTDFMKTLSERDERIMKSRILAEEPVTLRELGEALGVTRERVRQLEARLVSELRTYMRERLVDFESYAPEGE